jgi:hypothetical protein
MYRFWVTRVELGVTVVGEVELLAPGWERTVGEVDTLRVELVGSVTGVDDTCVDITEEAFA